MRDLPERHAATATLPGIMLEQSLLRVMLPDQREHPLGRLSLRQHAILGAARAWSARPPFTSGSTSRHLGRGRSEFGP